ncbi:MAG: AAA family ATPase [Actinomycetes bacterium]
MKVVVVGKGGSGKTTTSAVLARELGARGRAVVAMDCDANANLALSLGLGLEVAEDVLSVRERVDAGEEPHVGDIDELLRRFARPGPDGSRFLVAQRIERPGAGCPCCGMSPQQLLNELPRSDEVVVADMEAGTGTLTRVDAGAVDVAVIVAEPTAKSLDVGERAHELALAKEVPTVLLVVNRVRDATDLDQLRGRFDGLRRIVVPDDPAVTRADRDGSSPVDVEPTPPAVSALRGLADLLGEPAG